MTTAIDRTAVLRAYALEVELRGQRGAYARTGRVYGISDETVRRWVHEAEQEADDLAYTPPPGGYSTPHPAEPLAEMPQNMPHELEDATQDATDTPQSATDATDEPKPLVQPDATPYATIATRHTFERRVATLRLDPGWEVLWGWGYEHMPAVQLALGVVILMVVTVWIGWG